MGVTIQKIGSNLITQGNGGTFESDPSTWGGIPQESQCIHSRTLDQAQQGSHSMQMWSDELGGFPADYFTLVRLQVNVVAGKTYWVEGYVRAATGGDSPGDDTVGYEFKATSGVTDIIQVFGDVYGAKLGWQKIEYKFTPTATGVVLIHLRQVYDGSPYYGSPTTGKSYLDGVTCYEYEVVDDGGGDPSPTCDLAIDLGSTVVTDETEVGADDGTILVIATSTNGPIEYTIWGGTPWTTANYFAGLAPGNYSILLRDALGCTAGPYVVTVEEGVAPPSCDVLINEGASTITDETGPGANDGSITVVATSTNGPIEYSNNDGSSWQDSNVFSGLAPGDYLVKARDKGNPSCITGPVIMTVLAYTIVCDLAITDIVATPTTTVGGSEGTVTVTATSSAGGLEYSIDGGQNYQGSNVFTGLVSGPYYVRVRDAWNCQVTSGVAVVQNPVCDITLDNLLLTHESFENYSDGAITVVASSTHTPIQYSKDNGQNYQATGVFLNLSPGVYSLRIKDAINCNISQFVIINAGLKLYGAIYFDKNPIVYTRPASGNKAQPYYRIRNEVRIETLPGSEVYDKTIFSSELDPDSDDLHKFYIQEAFRGVLKASPPAKTQAQITRLTDRLVTFKCYYGDVYGALEAPASYSASDRYLVLKGGLSKEAYVDLGNFFTSYLVTHKKFMSWQPVSKTVHLDQEEFLNFFVWDKFINRVSLKIKAYWDDETNQTSTTKVSGSILYGHLLSVPLGPASSGAVAIDPAKNLVKYEAWLVNQNNAVVSEVRTYIIDPYKKPATRYFMFLGSLGSFETIRATGLGTKSSSFSRQIVQKHMESSYSSSESEFEMITPNMQDAHEFSTGFATKERAEYFKDMLLTTKFYDITSGKRVPLQIMTDQVQISSDRDNKYFVRFSCKGGFVNEVFTPENA